MLLPKLFFFCIKIRKENMQITLLRITAMSWSCQDPVHSFPFLQKHYLVRINKNLGIRRKNILFSLGVFRLPSCMSCGSLLFGYLWFLLRGTDLKSAVYVQPSSLFLSAILTCGEHPLKRLSEDNLISCGLTWPSTLFPQKLQSPLFKPNYCGFFKGHFTELQRKWSGRKALVISVSILGLSDILYLSLICKVT